MFICSGARERGQKPLGTDIKRTRICSSGPQTRCYKADNGWLTLLTNHSEIRLINRNHNDPKGENSLKNAVIHDSLKKKNNMTFHHTHNIMWGP